MLVSLFTQHGITYSARYTIGHSMSVEQNGKMKKKRIKRIIHHEM